LNKVLHTGLTSAMALALFFGLGEHSAAIAQQAASSLPVVTKALPAVKLALPAIKYALPATSRPLTQPTPTQAPAVATLAAPLRSATALAQPATLGRPAAVRMFTLPLQAMPTVAGQPLSAMVDAQGNGPALDAEATCLATAVYFESMGEPLEGQLAVAQVVINRTKSGRYPTSLCGVVRQKAQFSFVRGGQFPRINAACQAWRKAQAIARIAAASLAQVLPADVLWYHADYVAPSWGRRLARVDKIGAHIFYRA
jgi:spore germination cell wall hydrolase CwlJ-like protein